MNPVATPVATAIKAVAPREPAQKTIVFNQHFDLEFGVGGVSERPSGTSGNNDEVRIVMRNCGVNGLVATKAVDSEISAAAEISEDALRKAIEKRYRATGPTLSAWGRAMNEDWAYNPWQD